MTTPLRHILTARGVLSGLRDAMYRQMSSVDDLTLLNHHPDTWILNTSLVVLATSTVFLQQGLIAGSCRSQSNFLQTMKKDDKIRPWKQFTRTERIVKAMAIVLICIFAKNVESVR
jgi:hypothetical protein